MGAIVLILVAVLVGALLSVLMYLANVSIDSIVRKITREKELTEIEDKTINHYHIKGIMNHIRRMK